MIGVNSQLNWFSWFVAFYIFAMITMPFVGRLIDKKPLLYSLVCIGAFFTGGVALHEFYPNYKMIGHSAFLIVCYKLLV